MKKVLRKLIEYYLPMHLEDFEAWAEDTAIRVEFLIAFIVLITFIAGACFPFIPLFVRALVVTLVGIHLKLNTFKSLLKNLFSSVFYLLCNMCYCVQCSVYYHKGVPVALLIDLYQLN